MDDAAFQRLVLTGRKRGFLTIDDLEHALPVSSMTPAELAGIIARLEDAGVPVDLDERLTRRPAHDHRSAPDAAGTIRLPDPEPSEPAAAIGATAPVVPPPSAPSSAAWRRMVAMAGAIAAVVLVIVVALVLGRAVR